MTSPQEKTLPALPPTHDIMRSVPHRREDRGGEEHDARQSRQALHTLREVVVIRGAARQKGQKQGEGPS
ncbi:MAG: hypothetical protein R6T83_07185 [Salinibacter sp.]